MRQPKIETAVRIYHEYIELGNTEIRCLFGNDIGTATIVRLKKAAFEAMAKADVRAITPYAVNTKIAFATWGLDITDLERRYKKLTSLGFSTNTDNLEPVK